MTSAVNEKLNVFFMLVYGGQKTLFFCFLLRNLNIKLNLKFTLKIKINKT